MSYVTHLECGACSETYERGRLWNLCAKCGKPLLVRYDLAKAAAAVDRSTLGKKRSGMWRYREIMPVVDDDNIVSLGEGWTPTLGASRLGKAVGLRSLYIKDESVNPTQSFKARGMSAAVSMAKELGVTKLAVPSAGNAGGALAAYAARAGMEAHIFMPRDTPRANVVECIELGANVTLIDGLITDCGAEVARRKDAEGWFDVSTLKEPYRVEGKKTLGYELAEFFDWTLPDVIVYPTGGGTGLIGMWKAFEEMEQMGWIDSRRPRMVSVQATGCAPIVRAFESGERFANMFENASTVASGLRVPKAIGDFLILDAIRASGGTAIAVSDTELIDAVSEIGAAEGLLAAPEGGACLPALKSLIATGDIGSDDVVVIFNTGSGIKYLEALDGERERVGSLEISQDDDFQRKSWRVQRIGWIAMLLFAVAGLLGIFGEGPLSSTQSGGTDSGLIVKHERFTRVASRQFVDLIVTSPGAPGDSTFDIWIDRSWLNRNKLLEMTPQPSSSEIEPDRIVFTFDSASDARPALVHLELENRRIGRIKSRFGVGDAAPVEFAQLVYP